MKLEPSKAKIDTNCKANGIWFALAYEQKQNLLYGAGTDFTVYGVQLGKDKLEPEKKWKHHESYISALALTSDEVISASYDGHLCWTTAADGKLVRRIPAHDGWVREIAVCPDNERLVTVGDDLHVKIWDSKSGKLLKKLSGHQKTTPQGYSSALYTVATTHDGKHIASADRTGEVRIWASDSGKLEHRFTAPTFYTYDAKARVRSIGGIRSLRFSNDDDVLALSGIGKVTNVDGFVGPYRIELWDWRNSKSATVIQDKHKAVLNDVQFHPTEPILLAAGGGDSGGVLTFIDTRTKKLIHNAKFKGHAHRIVFVKNNQIATGGYEGLHLWNC